MSVPEPVDTDFSAVIVYKKQPFLDWLNDLPDAEPGLSLDAVNEDPKVFLLPDAEDYEFPREWVRKNFKAIFAEELESYWTEEERWPEHRSWTMFEAWFKVEYASDVEEI